MTRPRASAITTAVAPAEPPPVPPSYAGIETMVEPAADHGAAASASPGARSQASLHGALLDSRQRWRDLVSLFADIAFETDSWGRFTFVHPDPVLGWSAGTMIGQPAELLLTDAGGGGGVNPFRPTVAVRGRRAWLRRADGSWVSVVFAVAPILDANGHIVGARGIGIDTTEQEGRDAAVVAALRRGEVLDQILWSMRKEVLAPRMMQAALGALIGAVGAQGCVVVDLLGDGVRANALHRIGIASEAVMQTALSLLERADGEAVWSTANDGSLVLACPSAAAGKGNGHHGLVLWRAAGGRDWDVDDRGLASSATVIIRVILDHDAMQQEMARQARTDPLTGLLNRRAFMDEMGRRIERLERDSLPGTLMFVDLDNFKELNDRYGHDVGDEALCTMARVLRDAVRPADLVARFGGDEFAMWLDGADDLTAAERAERLGIEAPRLLHTVHGAADSALGMSIGIATRVPGKGEGVESLLQRADRAMYDVKRHGRGHWRVSHEGGTDEPRRG
jgi:diguanylate cyclase (GGDEF)-like protein